MSLASLAIAIAQINPVQGDLADNARRIAEAARSAHAQGAELLLLAEGALTGPHLGDLAQRPAFVQVCIRQIHGLAAALADLKGLSVILPFPYALGDEQGGAPHSQAGRAHGRPAFALLHAGRCATHAVAADTGICMVAVQGRKLALLLADACLCADSGRAGSHADSSHAGCADRRRSLLHGIGQAGAELLVVAGCAPYRMGQVPAREQSLSTLARQAGLPVVSAHLVGGQGERIYDGASLAVQANGDVAGRATQFAQALWRVVLQTGPDGRALHASTDSLTQADGWVGGLPESMAFAQPFSHAEVWQALVLGLRDHVHKSGFRDVALGFSGGMDSALVLALAVDALGKDHVRALMMPSVHTADISLADAADMAQRLGVRYDVVPIAPLCAAFDMALAPLFAGRGADVTEENIQARVRGNLLMAVSNKHGCMVLSTGNKSELSVGYCTLYGDMAGGLAPLKDIFKTQVYALARWRNAHDPFGAGASPIPERIITRAPSAELRPDQTDQDSLPPYEVLDAILAGYMECDATVPQLLEAGLPADAVEQVVRLVRINEYKRQQAAPGLCISRRGFGCDWRYPLVNRFAEGD